MISAKVKFDVAVPFEDMESIMSREGYAEVMTSVILACIQNFDFDFDDNMTGHISGALHIKDLDKYRNMLKKANELPPFVPITEIPGFRKK